VFRAELLKGYQKFPYAWHQINPVGTEALTGYNRRHPTHSYKASQTCEDARVLYCDFQRDNFGFEDLRDLESYRFAWGMDSNALQKYARHITIRCSMDEAVTDHLESLICQFASIETVTMHEPNLSRHGPNFESTGIPSRTCEGRIEQVWAEHVLRVSLEKTGRKVPKMIDICDGKEYRSYKRDMGDVGPNAVPGV
jgi:hypothetical protein